MDLGIVLISAAVFGWGLLSARLEQANLTAPMIFIAVGGTLAGFTPVSARWLPVLGRKHSGP